MDSKKRWNNEKFDNSDNSLNIKPNQSHKRTAQKFVHLVGSYSTIFLRFMQEMETTFVLEKQLQLITTKSELQKAVYQLKSDSFVIVQDYNEYLMSFRGKISYIAIGNSKKAYLIDCITLNSDLTPLLKQIFEEIKIIKFMYYPLLTTQNLKRDYSIFPCNYFQLRYLQSFFTQLKNDQDPRKMKNFCLSLKNKQNSLLERPLAYSIIIQVKKNYESLVDYVLKLGSTPKSMQTDSQSKITYKRTILNHYLGSEAQKFQSQRLAGNILKPYTYHDQQQAMNLGSEFKSLLKFFIDLPDLKHYSEIEYNLFQQLVAYREHISRIFDLHPNRLLSNFVIADLVNQSINTYTLDSKIILPRNHSELGPKIQPILHKFQFLPIHIFSMCRLTSQIKNIIEIFMEKQLNQSKISKQVIMNNKELREKLLKYKRMNPEKDKVTVKKLLNDIQWKAQGEWLNDVNDPALKLYKQIISFQDFDHSIFYDFSDLVSPEILSIQQICNYSQIANIMRYGKKEDMQLHLTKMRNEQEQMEKKSEKKMQIKKIEQNQLPDSDEDLLLSKIIQKPLSAKLFYNTQRQTYEKKAQIYSDKKKISIKMAIQSENILETSTQILQMQEKQINIKYIKPIPKNLSQVYKLSNETENASKQEVIKTQQSLGQPQFIPQDAQINSFISWLKQGNISLSIK